MESSLPCTYLLAAGPCTIVKVYPGGLKFLELLAFVVKRNRFVCLVCPLLTYLYLFTSQIKKL